MYDNHELYRAEYEERMRQAVERNRFREFLPIKPNWLVAALGQLRIFLF